MNLPADVVHEQLRALRVAYAAQLGEKVEQIAQGWDLLRGGAWDRAAARSLHRYAHTLAGSGATFGFPEVSAAARAIERVLKPHVEAGTEPAAHDLAAIDLALTRLRSAADAGAAAAELPASNRQVPPRPAQHERRRLIYLVEDDSTFARDLALQIGYFGYRVQVFSCAAELLEAMQRELPAALVVDIVLPDGDGAEAAAEIRRVVDATTPVIFLSVREDLEARLGAVRAGGLAYFTKPVDVGLLIDRLDAITGGQSTEAPRILIVEDSPPLAAYAARTLEAAGMLTQIVAEPAALLAPLAEFQPDLILMDVYMPGCSGPELAAVIRQQEAYVGTPIVYLSAETDRDRQLAAMGEGGDDFLTKPIAPDHLIAAVTSRVKRARAMRALMVRDSLTGLLNHTVIKERLQVELARASRTGAPLTFALIDIDRFKQVNDTHGHQVGDRVLRSLARLLRQRLRESDGIGRYGGEEFALVLPETDPAGALTLLDELRVDFARICHLSERGEFQVSFSGGLASFPHHTAANALTHAADQALYRAKRAGRNRLAEG